MDVNKWFVIDNVVKKNPKPEDFEGVEKHHIVELRRGNNEDLIVERWWVDLEKETFIDFAYSPSFIGKHSHMTKNEIRNLHWESCGLDPNSILWDKCYILPPSYFTDNTVKLPAGFGR